MRKAITRTFTVLIIAALSIGCGLLYDKIYNKIERSRFPCEYAEAVKDNADRFGIPENVIFSVLKVESNFDSSLKTGTGNDMRIGLMQLTGDDCAEYSEFTDGNIDPGLRYEPETNIKIGSNKIFVLYEKYNDWKCVFAAFRAGTECVDEWLNDSSLVGEHGKLKTIPNAEISAYVDKIEKTIDKYNKLYNVKERA